MKSQIISYSYNNNPISFDFSGGEKMINATEMAKFFGKRPVDFLRLPQTEKFIKVLKVRLSHNKNEVVKTVKGRYNSGTWMHEKLALKFAAWLSPEFELWVFDRVEELLLTGKTELETNKPVNPLDMLELMLKNARLQEKRMLEIEEKQNKLALTQAENESQVDDEERKLLHDFRICESTWIYSD